MLRLPLLSARWTCHEVREFPPLLHAHRMAGSSAGRRHQHGSDAAITSLDRPLAPPSSVALQAQLFRTLTWNASVPLCIRLSSDDLPAGADRIIDCLYVRLCCTCPCDSSSCGMPLTFLAGPHPRPQIQAPRISYLSLLLPQIRRELLNLVIDEGEAALIKDDDLWFGITGSGDALKWCVCAALRTEIPPLTEHEAQAHALTLLI